MSNCLTGFIVRVSLYLRRDFAFTKKFQRRVTQTFRSEVCRRPQEVFDTLVSLLALGAQESSAGPHTSKAFSKAQRSVP
jgi:hypothetical protein